MMRRRKSILQRKKLDFSKTVAKLNTFNKPSEMGRRPLLIIPLAQADGKSRLGQFIID